MPNFSNIGKATKIFQLEFVLWQQQFFKTLSRSKRCLIKLVCLEYFSSYAINQSKHKMQHFVDEAQSAPTDHTNVGLFYFWKIVIVIKSSFNEPILAVRWYNVTGVNEHYYMQVSSKWNDILYMGSRTHHTSGAQCLHGIEIILLRCKTTKRVCV